MPRALRSEQAASRADTEMRATREEDRDVAVDELNSGTPDELIVVVPLSSSRSPSALRPEVSGVAGVDRPSRAICRGLRAVSRARLLRPLGALPPATLKEVERSLAFCLTDRTG